MHPQTWSSADPAGAICGMHSIILQILVESLAITIAYLINRAGNGVVVNNINGASSKTSSHHASSYNFGIVADQGYQKIKLFTTYLIKPGKPVMRFEHSLSE